MNYEDDGGDDDDGERRRRQRQRRRCRCRRRRRRCPRFDQAAGFLTDKHVLISRYYVPPSAE